MVDENGWHGGLWCASDACWDNSTSAVPWPRGQREWADKDVGRVIMLAASAEIPFQNTSVSLASYCVHIEQ